MKPGLLTAAFLAALLLMWTLPASAQLQWRVSVKFILDDNGNRATTGLINTNAEVQSQIDLGNDVLNATGRGYRLWLTEIVDVSGASEWFDADLSIATRDGLEEDALADPQTYAWATNAINIYILGSNISGVCSFPDDGTEIIVVGQGLRTTTFLHEIGHFFDLCHTQGCTCGSCNATQTGTCHTVPGSDAMNDTPPDLQCWLQNDIAQNLYGLNYGQLNTTQQEFVDASFFNMMSYHATRNRLTSDQLDNATDFSNGFRNFVATGNTIFVDGSHQGPQTGASFYPFIFFFAGVNAASSGDIVMVRAGSYTDTGTLSSPRTYRGWRGEVTFGSAVAKAGESTVVWRPNYPDTFDGRSGP